MVGSLKLFVGPMMSGKTGRLVAEASPFAHSSAHTVVVFQPAANIRDGKKVTSRNGSTFTGVDTRFVTIFPSFDELRGATVVVIEEFHFFGTEMIVTIARLLEAGVNIYTAGLDMDYSGALTDRFKDLLQLAPDGVVYCKSVCHVCGAYDARYTQVYLKGVPVLEGLPQVVPEDGTYGYQPVCCAHFKHL